MKKIVWPLAALALLAAIGFKLATDPWLHKPSPASAGVPALHAQVTQPSDAAADGICRGTMTVALFSPSMGVVQADVDAYNQRYKDEAKTCDELTFLGNVDYGDGNVDYLYRMKIAGHALWYIFTVTDGLVSNIQ